MEKLKIISRGEFSEIKEHGFGKQHFLNWVIKDDFPRRYLGSILIEEPEAKGVCV